MDSKTLTREEIIVHLDTPVCGIMSGVRIHVQTIGLLKMWQLCYALRCNITPQCVIITVQAYTVHYGPPVGPVASPD